MLLTAALVLVLVTGCAGDDSPQVETHEAPTGSASPIEVAVPANPPTQDTDWKVLNRWPVDRRFTGEYNGRYRAVVDEHDTWSDRSQTARFFDAQGRRVLTRTSGGGGWFTQDVWLTEHYAVVEDLNLDVRTIRLFVYDLRTGRRIGVRGPAVSQPEMDASAGRVAYLSGRAKTKMCLQLLDLDTRTTSRLACGGRGEVLGDVAMDAEGDVTYSSVRHPDTRRRCKTVFVVRAGERTPQPVHAQRNCLPWSGAILVDAVAWDETDPNDPDLGLAFGRGYVEHDGMITSLGFLDTDTLISCGGRFFWEVQDERGSRIDSIQPGENPITIWGPEENGSPTGLECADGRWLHLSIGDVSSDNLPTKFQVLDTTGE